MNQIMNCYQPNDVLTSTLRGAMSDALSGSSGTAAAKMLQTYPLFQQALANCGDIQEPMTEYL